MNKIVSQTKVVRTARTTDIIFLEMVDGVPQFFIRGYNERAEMEQVSLSVKDRVHIQGIPQEVVVEYGIPHCLSAVLIEGGMLSYLSPKSKREIIFPLVDIVYPSVWLTLL